MSTIFAPLPCQLCHHPMTVLSLFPGAGLFERGFFRSDVCIVRGPDIIWHQDVREFNAAPGVFDGIIAGPPCQDFSKLRRTPPTGNGLAMLAETVRIIRDAAPVWFLIENVPACPTCDVPGYAVQAFNLDASHVGAAQSRLRKFQFGRREGLPPLQFHRPVTSPGSVTLEPAAVANDDRSVTELARLQGYGPDFTLPCFTRVEAKRAIGNGVPLAVSNAWAESIELWTWGASELSNPCACGCGRNVKGRHKTASAACRKRLERQRKCDVAGVNPVTDQGEARGEECCQPDLLAIA